MENCPVCGEKLMTIAGYDNDNFCRKCNKLFWNEDLKEEEND